MTIPNYRHDSSTPYGLHVPYNRGYDANSRHKLPSAENFGSAGNFYSAALNAKLEVWITDLTADFSISGDTGQSRMVREFFPHSFNDITLTITGNVANTQQFNRLSAFVRQSHWQSLANVNANKGTTDQTIQFTLYDNTPGGRHKRPQHATDVIINGDPTFTGPEKAQLTTVKGAHRPWVVHGYIQTMAAGAQRWEVAPEFQIQFIVTASTLGQGTGIWSDTPDNRGSTLKTFLELLSIANKGDRVQGPGFVTGSTVPAPNTPAGDVYSALQGLGKALHWSADAVKTAITNGL